MEEEMVVDSNNNLNDDDEDESSAVEYSFTAYEVDLEYEFDAARFFDFSRDESPVEASQAELWFHSAPTYPPSPFVARLAPKEEIMMNVSPKSKGVENLDLSEGYIELDQESLAVGMNNCGDDYGHDRVTCPSLQIGSQQKIQSQKLPSGLTFYNHMVSNINSAHQTKLSMKPSFSRTSTLMKPTASQLAKQNRPFQGSRSHASVSEKTDKITASTLVIENQAAKRQKLEGGLLRKVSGAVQLQQTNFVHKAPKREGFIDGNTTHTKPRITIPREPDLETAQRAQRTRPKSSKEAENVKSTFRRFRALPLNRKILEGPSLLPKKSIPRLPDFQEFHLKTSQRAMQHSSAVLNSRVPDNHPHKDLHKYTSNLSTGCGNREPTSLIHASRSDACQSSSSFRALPLNKKILTSKGDIGIFRNAKKETTVPVEFKFQTEKRVNSNPPIELFNKLSLASETQPNANSSSKLLSSMGTQSKGSKENRRVSFQQANEIIQPAKPKVSLLGGNQQLCPNDVKKEVTTASAFNWGKKSIR